MRVFAGGDKAPEAVRRRNWPAPLIAARSCASVVSPSPARRSSRPAARTKTAKGNTTGTTKAPDTTAAGASSTTQAPPPSEASPDDKTTDLHAAAHGHVARAPGGRGLRKAAPLLKSRRSSPPRSCSPASTASTPSSCKGRPRRASAPTRCTRSRTTVPEQEPRRPEPPTLPTDIDIVKFAMSLEDSAASTYVTAPARSASPSSVRRIMAIGGVEARHAAILARVLNVSRPDRRVLEHQGHGSSRRRSSDRSPRVSTFRFRRRARPDWWRR